MDLTGCQISGWDSRSEIRGLTGSAARRVLSRGDVAPSGPAGGRRHLGGEPPGAASRKSATAEVVAWQRREARTSNACWARGSSA